MLTCIFDFRYTTVYLACKVEEFNISIDEFVNNINVSRQEKEDYKDIILSQGNKK